MPSRIISDDSSTPYVAPPTQDWNDFLRHKVNSFIKWDLVRFFHDNPHTKDTLENLARYVWREPKTIERELNELVVAQVLRKEEVNGAMLYLLSDHAEVQRLINVFMEACQDRDFRVMAIAQVIMGMQPPRNNF
ncbi:MAG: hypothetical protein H7Y11_00945 [Armatimonadetes bacterium]|nr:hypothetical protein [Anaerolineae bacterium]